MVNELGTLIFTAFQRKLSQFYGLKDQGSLKKLNASLFQLLLPVELEGVINQVHRIPTRSHRALDFFV